MLLPLLKNFISECLELIGGRLLVERNEMLAPGKTELTSMSDSKGHGWRLRSARYRYRGPRSGNSKIYIRGKLPRVTRQLQGQTTQRRK